MRVFVPLAALSMGALAATTASAQAARFSTGSDALTPDARTVHIASVYVPSDGLVIARAVRDGHGTKLNQPLAKTDGEARRLGDAARLAMEAQQRRWDQKIKALSGSICIGC